MSYENGRHLCPSQGRIILVVTSPPPPTPYEYFRNGVSNKSKNNAYHSVLVTPCSPCMWTIQRCSYGQYRGVAMHRLFIRFWLPHTQCMWTILRCSHGHALYQVLVTLHSQCMWTIWRCSHAQTIYQVLVTSHSEYVDNTEV